MRKLTIINFSPFSVSRFGERCNCRSSGRKIKNGLSSGHYPLEIIVSKDGGEASSRGIIASFKNTQIRTAFYPCSKGTLMLWDTFCTLDLPGPQISLLRFYLSKC